ncbi:MAG: diguanylate cyclase, partial [Lautropia sp.]|nr:diguanylate cyclase [Lautropia sp.]
MSPELHFSVGGQSPKRSEDTIIQEQVSILLLNADPVTRATVENVLVSESLGQLIAVDDFQAAGEEVRHRPPPALVLLSIPADDDGATLDALRQHRHQPEWQRLTIMLLAPGTRQDLWQAALELNLADVLFKPLDRAALTLKLRQCLGMKIYRDRLLKQDLLTGLTNRAGLLRRLEAVLQTGHSSKGYTLMLLDIDRFRQLNDSLGHQVGDAFLKAVSQRLNDVVSQHSGPERRRPGVTISPWLARIGSDSFMALLPGRPGEACHDHCIQALHQALALPLHLEGRELFISASIGMAVFPEHAHDANQLTRQAERALAVAKRRGGHRTEYFDPTQTRVSINALTLENHLRHAIRYNELQLVYQPKISSKTLEIVGVEALIRWQHRELGMILP